MDYKRENLSNTKFADFFPAFSYFLKKAGFRSLYKYLIKQFEQTIATYTQQTFITQAGSMETIITTWGTQSTWAFTQPCAISILWPASRPTRGLAWPVPEAQTTHTYQTVHTILSPILCLERVSQLRALRKPTVPNAESERLADLPRWRPGRG